MTRLKELDAENTCLKRMYADERFKEEVTCNNSTMPYTA